ncbi:MAG: T9SS type A sorting domain-containing protein [Muribaculaceae bacterium]|nr:T9SS type A sorting domain-containing protein [Muribaculaceae bacterium]
MSGNAEVSIDMPGVYVVRLINGNNVKIQKIIIK